MTVIATEVDRVAQDSPRFYQMMAVLCAAIAFVGFLPSYWAPMWHSTLQVSHMAQLHGGIFFTWTLFFVLQTSLVARGRTAMHRELGLLGIALATAMLFTGFMVTVRGMNGFIARGFADEAFAFSLVPLSAIVYFAAVIAYAVANIRRPEVHKRAMLLATVSLLQPAVARWFIFFLAPPGAQGPVPVVLSIAPGLVADLPLVYALIHDWRTRGRPHPVYVIGAITLIAIQLLRLPVSATASWFAIAGWLSAF